MRIADSTSPPGLSKKTSTGNRFVALFGPRARRPCSTATASSGVIWPTICMRGGKFGSSARRFTTTDANTCCDGVPQNIVAQATNSPTFHQAATLTPTCRLVVGKRTCMIMLVLHTLKLPFLLLWEDKIVRVRPNSSNCGRGAVGRGGRLWTDPAYTSPQGGADAGTAWIRGRLAEDLRQFARTGPANAVTYHRPQAGNRIGDIRWRSGYSCGAGNRGSAAAPQLAALRACPARCRQFQRVPLTVKRTVSMASCVSQ